MLAITRFLDWLDESAAGFIRVAYLLAGVIAVASYFSDGNVPPSFSHFLNAVLPWVLAAALEIHTYLSARRVRSAYQALNAAASGSDEHERAERTMRVNLWILAGLLLFSMYNQLQYLASSWTPPHVPLTPPGPWAYVIRAVITPAAFMCAAFLAPMGEGMAAQIQAEAHHLTAAAFKAASQQWKRKLREMQRSGQDITAALVELVDDPAERRVIATIHRAIHGQPITPVLDAPATGLSLEAPAAATVVVPDPSRDPDPSPQGPGPRGGTTRAAAAAGSARPARPVALQLVPSVAAAGGAASAATARRSSSGRQGGNTSRAMEENAQLRAQRVAQAREILARNGRISAEALGELIGAPKTVALGIKREIQAEARGARSAAAGQRQTRQKQQRGA